jgi:AAT family amino acid transporter
VSLPDSFDSIAQREQGLERRLSSRQLSMIAIGGAIGTGLFLGSGFAISFAGPSVLISYGIGAVITMLLMGCMAEMTVAHSTSGSFGAWAEYYISPLAGFLLRFVYWAGLVLALGSEVSAVAVYMHFWFPAVPGWIWVAGFALLMISVNSVGVGLFGAVEYGFSALKISAIVVFILLGAWMVYAAPHGSGIGFANYTAFGGFFPNGFSGTWVAVLIALFSYFSIEMIAVAAGEARDPQEAIIRAFRVTMMRLVLFYLLTLALVLAIVPWTVSASSGAQSPFVTVMQHTHIPGAAGVINLVILVAALSAMNSQLYISTRMLFSLARSGFAPAGLGRLTRRGVPLRALFLCSTGMAVAAVVSAMYHERAFLLMLSLSLFAPMFTWLMIFITHYQFRRRTSTAALPFRMWGFPWTTLAGGSLMLAALLTTPFTAAFRPTLVYGIPFLLLLTLAYQLRSRRMEKERVQIIQRAGSEEMM